MSEEWIFRCWDFRDDVGVSANDEHLVKMSSVFLAVIVFLIVVASLNICK